MKSVYPMPFGAHPLEAGGARFRLWAPSCDVVQLELMHGGSTTEVERLDMHRAEGGWHVRVHPSVAVGSLYRYRVGGGLQVPDPASRFNPLDVHGPSELVDPGAYVWGNPRWRGRPWHEAVVYELHVGAFTPQGSLRAAQEKLPLLRDLGITALELMPLADFSGRYGWGYDGVLLYAPESTYGRPEDLKRFVDAAHALGMMVLLDVVYNHFGPDGNYLSAYCPEFFNPQHTTAWGPGIHFDGPHGAVVRSFFIHNALFWLEEYRLDGLRLDAVHAIADTSMAHLVEDIASAVRQGPGSRREIHLVLENDDNTTHWLQRDDAQRPLLATAQWNDDLHHAAHVLATGETEGYYADYARDNLVQLARALAEGFVYQGQPSPFRGGAPRGEPSAGLPSQAFVAFLQNHDQIGNRALAERIDSIAQPGRVELLIACLLLSPQVPMLFMGEEFAATSPFLYFCDYAGELGAAVTRGRRAEFAAFAGFGDAAGAQVPDPNDAATFAASRLDWRGCDTPHGQRRWALVQRLLAARREVLQPLLPLQRHGGSWVTSADCMRIEWPLGDEMHWVLWANFGELQTERSVAAHEQLVFRLQAGSAHSAPDQGDPAPGILRAHEVQVLLRRRSLAS